MKNLPTNLFALLTLVSASSAQEVVITGVPNHGQAGQVTGYVTGVNPSTHRLAHNLYVEGGGWWTVGGTNIPINSDGSFAITIGTAGNDEFASHYSVSLRPIGTSAPANSGANTLDLGSNIVASTYEQRYGRTVSFAGYEFGIKETPSPAGPGGNRFSSSPDHIWVDEDGLHLTIQNSGGAWRSTEAILPQNLGYGTYLFKTNSRQDILDANATFGAFTWDVFGDDERIPAWPNREIDFEDSRWGNPGDPTSSQVVVQPWWVPGNLKRFDLPNLSGDAHVTRFFKWSPGKVEFFTLLGDHSPDDFPQSAIIDHTIYTEDSPDHIVPEPGRENFRFNLWLNQGVPFGGGPVEVLVTDFAFLGLGDFNLDGSYDCSDADALVAEIAAGTNSMDFDLNGDGLVEGDDLDVWLAEAGAANLPAGGAYLPGDANLDGFVDGQDFVDWNSAKFTATAAWCSGDFDASGVVDGQDFIIWNNHKFTSADGLVASGSVVVPEPEAALSMLLLVVLTCRHAGRTGRRG